jgi:hypothetical protein
MKHGFKFAAALVFILMTQALACGGSMVDTSLSGELDQARSLNTDLKNRLREVDTTLSTTLTTVEALPAVSVDRKTVDIELVRNALTECFESPVQAAGDAAASADVAAGGAGSIQCKTDSSAALMDIKGMSEPAVAGFIDTKVNAIATLKVNLKDRLPNMATTILQEHADAKVSAAALRKTTESKKATLGGTLTGESKTKWDAEYADLIAELDALDALLNSMETEAAGLPDKVRTTVERVTYALSNFGQEN